MGIAIPAAAVMMPLLEPSTTTTAAGARNLPEPTMAVQASRTGTAETLEPILKLRRYERLSLSEGPSEWLPMFNSMENNGAVWAMSVEREAWKQEL